MSRWGDGVNKSGDVGEYSAIMGKSEVVILFCHCEGGSKAVNFYSLLIILPKQSQ